MSNRPAAPGHRAPRAVGRAERHADV